MNSEVKLSIIIPAYNVENYLPDCLNSCLNQDISSNNYEIIIINDGSKDRTLKIAEDYKNKYNNIDVYSQENSGLSIARNVGFKYAKGEYIWFVDSDDTIEINCLAKVLTEIGNKDILAFGCVDISENVICNKYQYKFNDAVESGRDFVLLRKGDFLHGAPFYVFRREFLSDNSLAFYPNIFHEDSEFTPRALCLSQSLAVSNSCYYRRLIRKNSITHTVNVKRAYDLFVVIESLKKFIECEINDDRLRWQMRKLLPLLLNSSLSVMASASENQYDAYNRHFYQNKSSQIFLSSGDFRYFLEGLVLWLFRNPIKVYKVLKK